MSVQDRLDDAALLWRHGRREGAFLSTLVALAAIAREQYSGIGDRQGFERLLRSAHGWRVSIEYRGQQVDIDHLLYKWMRCQLVHEAGLPTDLRIDDDFAEPDSLSVRAGGDPCYTVLITPGWFYFLVDLVVRHIEPLARPSIPSA